VLNLSPNTKSQKQEEATVIMKKEVELQIDFNSFILIAFHALAKGIELLNTYVGKKKFIKRVSTKEKKLFNFLQNDI
jgi:hypothetical protein